MNGFVDSLRNQSTKLSYEADPFGTYYIVTGATSNIFGSIIIPSVYDNPDFAPNELPVLIIGNNAFRNQFRLSGVTIPNSITVIRGSAFRDCTGLTSITIPDSVTSFGTNAFQGCTGLLTINSLRSSAPTLLGSDTFLNVATSTINVPIGATGYGTVYGGLTVNYSL